MLIQGATSNFEFTLKDKNNNPIALAGASVDFMFKRNEFESTLIKPCNIIDAEQGKCSVELTPDDSSESGTCYCQLKITFSDNSVMRTEIISFFVEESL